VMLFALAVTLLTAAAFAVVPMLQMRRAELADLLKTESGASASLAQVRLRKLMVTAQLAFCVWLLIAAGLFARSLALLRAVDLGFRKEHLITFRMDPMMSGYQPDQTVAAYRRVSDALSVLPGVIAVANSDYGVFTGNVNLNALQIEGYQPPPPDKTTAVRELLVSSGYLRAMGMQLVAGRDFTEADLQQPVRTAIVNESFGHRYFNGQNPVGRHIGWSGPKQVPFEVVGVVRDLRYNGPAEDANPFYFLPMEQNGGLSFYVRTSQRPEALMATVGRVVSQRAPGVPLDQLRTMQDMFDATIGEKDRIASLAGFFGILATLLAAIGLYGVMTYTVARRTREIGIRMAVGAARGDVLRMVIREVGVVIACGLLTGVPTGLAITRLIRSQLYGVSPMDATASLVAAAIVAAIALLAGLLPARRATRIDPVRALRWE